MSSLGVSGGFSGLVQAVHVWAGTTRSASRNRDGSASFSLRFQPSNVFGGYGWRICRQAARHNSVFLQGANGNLHPLARGGAAQPGGVKRLAVLSDWRPVRAGHFRGAESSSCCRHAILSLCFQSRGGPGGGSCIRPQRPKKSVASSVRGRYGFHRHTRVWFNGRMWPSQG